MRRKKTNERLFDRETEQSLLRAHRLAGDSQFMWLPIEKFRQLTPSEKEAYLHAVAGELEQEFQRATR